MLSSFAPSLSASAAVTPAPERHRRLKQIIDVSLAAVLLLALLPLLGVIWLAVRLTSAGPAIFTQTRVGRHGTRFGAYKFRTMVHDADTVLAAHLATDPHAAEEYRLFRKLRRDPRITPIGAFLRRYSLDELPQLVNVLKGEMSLVGPRCYLPDEIADMRGREGIVLRVLPGLTGLWQVSGRNGTTFAERVAIDVRYVRGWSLALDLAILRRTAAVVLSGRDAY